MNIHLVEPGVPVQAYDVALAHGDFLLQFPRVSVKHEKLASLLAPTEIHSVY